MIIPSIDLQGGQTVQLVGGKERALAAGDPRPLMERFRLAGEVAVIDLDAALGTGENRALIEALLPLGPCRVGGGIRDAAAALDWLDRGAQRVILGTAARPELLRALPPERVIAALDAVDGELVVHGWQTKTGVPILERMRELEGLVGGFLVTFVEREGRLGGTAMERVEALREAAGAARLTVAGGVTTLEEIAALHRAGVDAQVGMAIYTGRLDLGDCIAAPLRSDRPDGLWPTVVCDQAGRALGLAWSDAESVRIAVARRQGVYHSRSRGLWVKGETSGATQELLRVDLDCDSDALRFTVRQAGPGFCHRDTATCWGEHQGLGRLERTLASRRLEAPIGSYTRRLFEDPELLGAKLVEEAGELARARTPEEVAFEAADVLFFTSVALVRAGLSIQSVEAELDRRALKVNRRPGDAKPGPLDARSGLGDGKQERASGPHGSEEGE
ncbi:MAG: phosphoribosyl-ATP diphosphatase [Polyangia bacterium]|jgi:phosphoribosyl-ATP pyrophosphohydrolase|nr:phosphoribosyl-ATP diphosphatase [Polyangia bacterium]